MKLDIREVTDKELWDGFVFARSPDALFQTWTWGEVLGRQRKKSWRFGLFQGNKIIGIFQVVRVSARRGTYLHIRHGPIISASDSEAWKYITVFLKKFAGEHHACFIRISPRISDSEYNNTLLKSFGMLPAAVHEVDAERCWVLDITPDKDTLLAGMRKTTRYEIRRTEKMGIFVKITEDTAELDAFFDLYQKTSKRQHFVAHGGIREEFEVFIREKKAVLLLGFHEQILLSAAIILFSGDQAIYHHGASMLTKFPVNYAVQWEAIREAKRRGMRNYNFWGIAPPIVQNHPWQGLTLFKTGFGGKEVRTIHAHDLPVSPRYWVTRGIEWWEKKRRGY